MKKLLKTTFLSTLLVSSIYANEMLDSYYIGVGNTKKSDINDTSLNMGFNIKFHEVKNISIKSEIGLSLSNNDNNFLDLLGGISYETRFGEASLVAGFTGGYLMNSDVVGTTYGVKYVTPFKNDNIEFSYKVSSLENSITKIEDLDRFSLNYIYKF